MPRILNARQDTKYKFPGIHFSESEFLSHKVLPTNLSYASWSGPVLDQGEFGSCVANGTAGLFYLFSNKHDQVKRIASRSAWYSQIENQLYPPAQDSGAESGDALLIWNQHGYVLESVRPYPADGNTKALLSPVIQSEWKTDYPVVSFSKLNNDILSIKKGMYSRGAALFGGTFATSWLSKTNKDGSLPVPDTVAGGHLWLNVGYSDTKTFIDDTSGLKSIGGFLSKNSWGATYGIQPVGAETSGYFWLPYYLWQYYPSFVPQDVYVATAN